MNKSAIDSLKSSSKTVKFVNYNSEEEAERTKRGPLYRRRLKEGWKQKNYQRLQDEQRTVANRAYNALIQDTNQAGIDDLVRNDQVFRQIFGLLFQAITDPVAVIFVTVQQTANRNRAQNRQTNIPTTLHLMRESQVQFDQIVQGGYHTIIYCLSAVGNFPAFSHRFLTLTPLSSEESGEDGSVASQNEAAEDNRAAAAGLRQDQNLVQRRVQAPNHAAGLRQAQQMPQGRVQPPNDVPSALAAVGFTRDQINACFEDLPPYACLVTASNHLISLLPEAELPPAARRPRCRPHCCHDGL